MIEVSAIALMGAAFTIVVPFLILIGIMSVQVNHRLDRIENDIHTISTDLSKLTERVAVLEEHGWPVVTS